MGLVSEDVGSANCRYRSPDTDPDTGPEMGLPIGLRRGCDGATDGAVMGLPIGLQYTDPSGGLAWLVVEWGVSS